MHRFFDGDRRDTDSRGRCSMQSGRVGFVMQETAEDQFAIPGVLTGVQNVLVPHRVDIGFGAESATPADTLQKRLVTSDGVVTTFLAPALG